MRNIIKKLDISEFEEDVAILVKTAKCEVTVTNNSDVVIVSFAGKRYQLSALDEVVTVKVR